MLACAGLTIHGEPPLRGAAARRALGGAVGLPVRGGRSGTALGAALLLAADGIASRLLGDGRAAMALKWIAPSLPMMGISAALRGATSSPGGTWRGRRSRR